MDRVAVRCRVWLSVVLLAFASSGCVDRIIKPDRLENWKAEASVPASVRITLFSAGSQPGDRADMVKGAEHEMLELPYICALVEHPAGNVLIDLGFGARHGEHVRSFGGRFWDTIMKPAFDPDRDALVNKLREADVDPASVKWLVVTHMHWDHVGGLADFPGARLVVTHAEWDWAHRSALGTTLRGYAKAQYDDTEGAAMLVEWPERPYGTFERSLDLFGDGSIVLVDTRGHTPGSMSVFVNLPSGKRFLFIGDAAWLRDNYRLPAHKGWKTRTIDNGRDGVMAMLWRIKRLEDLAPEVVIVPSHDPAVWKELKHAPFRYE